jgi:hypothetical protein
MACTPVWCLFMYHCTLRWNTINILILLHGIKGLRSASASLARRRSTLAAPPIHSPGAPPSRSPRPIARRALPARLPIPLLLLVRTASISPSTPATFVSALPSVAARPRSTRHARSSPPVDLAARAVFPALDAARAVFPALRHRRAALTYGLDFSLDACWSAVARPWIHVRRRASSAARPWIHARRRASSSSRTPRAPSSPPLPHAPPGLSSPCSPPPWTRPLPQQPRLPRTVASPSTKPPTKPSGRRPPPSSM